MGTLTLSMIVKNEEKYLKECLESVKGVVDDIIIVDTGSTDNTLEIAKEYKAKIYHFDWINDFSAARNYALQYSPGDWILYLDADERLDPASKSEIKKIINTNEKAGYYCTVKSIDEDAKFDHSIRYVRLFKKSPEIKFTGKVHEQIIHSLIENKYKLYHSSILINHIGYNISYDEKKIKAERNLSILIEEYNQDPSAYAAFKLGQTYFLIGKYDECQKYINIALEQKDLAQDLKADCYLHLSQIALFKGDFVNAQKLIDNAIELNPKQTFYYLMNSKIYELLNDNYKAKLYAQKAMECYKNMYKYEKTSFQNFYVDPKVISYHGLKLSYQSNDADSIEYFITELYKLIREENVAEKIQLIKLMESIFQGREITEDISQVLLKYIDKNNLELFLVGINRQKNNSIKYNLLSKLIEKFPRNVEVIKNLATLYDDMNNTKAAINLLESNRELIKDDPAALFYLASFYLKIQDVQKSYELFVMIENKFSYLTEMLPKVKVIRTKLENVIKKISN